MKVLITGGSGFIGSNLSIYLKNKGFDVYSLDNLFRNESKLNLVKLKKFKIKNYKIDIRDKKKILSLKKFDLIIDCCAEPSVNKSINEIDRVISTNLIGTLNILHKCAKDNARIIFLSSSRVYSIKNLRNIVRNKNINKKLKINKKIEISFDTNQAKSIYGFSKLGSELLIKEFCYLYKIQYLINRLGVIAGPWQYGKVDQGFMSLWIWRHMNKKNLNYIGFGGNGYQERDVLHIEDLCRLIHIQINKINTINNLTINSGGGLKNKISLRKLTQICEKVTKNKIKINKIKKTSIYDIPYYVSSNRDVKKIYNWLPKKNIHQIINDIYKWQLENKKNLKNFIS